MSGASFRDGWRVQPARDGALARLLGRRSRSGGHRRVFGIAITPHRLAN
jgi:hypothetical protein